MYLVVPKSFLGLAVISMLMLTASVVVTVERDEVLFLATTTSVDNSGLLQMLIDRYLQDHPHLKVYVAAKGTGAALKIAADGDADAVLVHAEKKELEFMSEGYGINRTTLWYNYFVLVGPEEDPAKVANSSTIVDALSRIAHTSSKFLSRGDESGTNIRELDLWNKTGINPKGTPWYLETGTGMARTLVTASELGGYTLTDIGTFMQLKANSALKLVILFDSENPELYNPYSYIIVNPVVHPQRNTARALDFLEFLMSSADLVRNYKANGITLFHPIEEGN